MTKIMNAVKNMEGIVPKVFQIVRVSWKVLGDIGKTRISLTGKSCNNFIEGKILQIPWGSLCRMVLKEDELINGLKDISWRPRVLSFVFWVRSIVLFGFRVWTASDPAYAGI